MKRRPALVLSRHAFNQQVKLAIVVPITSRIRGISLEVVLPDRVNTRGAILAHQIQTVDFLERAAEFIEKVPTACTDKVTHIAQVLIK